MRIARRKTRVVKIGNICIGGNNPVAIQSMVKTKTSNVRGAIKQINELEKAGCQILRLAVKDDKDVRAIKKIKPHAGIPLVADIHFDWRLSIAAIEAGVDKIRLNPGNIYKKKQIREIAKAAQLNDIPIRVGVNSGSLRGPKGHKTQAEAMVKSALDFIRILEGFKFYDIVVSLKGSNIFDTIEAYRKIARRCNYPLHLGVTATGAPFSGTIKSSIALGVLLSQGIGDTIRVSLTDKPQEEVKAAKAILGALDLRNFGPEIISCPTCGRCEVDLIKIVKDLEARLSSVKCRSLSGRQKLAVMGCVVNGPGEAKEADLGVAFGKKNGLLFKGGYPLKRVTLNNCINQLLKEARIDV
jgi:(E)-4-hydroxy-3-methylbut-2-enyl-diphosphate synthase